MLWYAIVKHEKIVAQQIHLLLSTDIKIKRLNCIFKKSNNIRNYIANQLVF